MVPAGGPALLEEIKSVGVPPTGTAQAGVNDSNSMARPSKIFLVMTIPSLALEFGNAHEVPQRIFPEFRARPTVRKLLTFRPGLGSQHFYSGNPGEVEIDRHPLTAFPAGKTKDRTAFTGYPASSLRPYTCSRPADSFVKIKISFLCLDFKQILENF